MKTLMLGNEAFARGLYEAGCGFVSSYPGTPSTEITESLAKYPEVYAEWAPNEKVALESAFGASLAGKRSFCSMKHVGMNVAADPMFTMSYTGVNAGLVIAVADDPSMFSSQNEQDSRHYAVAAKIPMLEPSDSREAMEFPKLAYELSEQYDTPVIIRICMRVAHSQGVVEPSGRKEAPAKKYSKDFAKYVCVPAVSRKLHVKVEERMLRLREYSENSPINFEVAGTDGSVGIITSSTCYQYVREAADGRYPILKLGMTNPLPDRKIIDFAKKVGKVIVVEELDGIIEEHCRNIGVRAEGKDLFGKLGEITQNVVSEKLGLEYYPGKALPDKLVARSPIMCAGCPHRGMYYVLKKHNLAVIGDIGCYTLGALPLLSAVDAVLCMGASVSALHGFNKATDGKAAAKTVAVIGDSTFVHSGITGLVSIVYNGSDSTVIILDNSTTGMTGHQQNPTTGFNLKGDPSAKICLEDLCRSVGVRRVRVVDPYDLDACEKAVLEELSAKEPSVIISRRPCALLKSVKHPGPIEPDLSKCVGCGACMKVGCPAVSVSCKKVSIDPTLCVGCGVCVRLCKTGALVKKGE